MIKKSNCYIKVKITRREYELYKKIVDNHNEKGIIYKDFEHLEKLSMSKLFAHSIRLYVTGITCDINGWSKDGKISR